MDKLEEAFSDFDLNRKYYLDAETGEVLTGIQDNYKIGDRYFEAPKLPASTKLSWMREFVDDMILFDCPDLFYKLKEALTDENQAVRFMEILSSHESGWIHGWAQWEADHIYEEIENWFCSLPINIEDDMSELDDDCPLCRMMKEGVNDLETLKKGFRQANFKQVMDDIDKNK